MKAKKLHDSAARLPAKISALGAAAAIVSLLTVGSAGAISLDVIGGTTAALPGGLNPYSLPAVDGLTVGTNIQYFSASDSSGGLTVSGSGLLTVEFIGTEAGFDNLAVFNGSINLANHGLHPTSTFTFGPGTVPFYFQTPGGSKAINGGTIDSNLLLGLYKFSSTVVYALFDDGGGGPPSDKDFDDFVVKITASCPDAGCQPPGGPLGPTPLPAALWLFGTVLAGGAGVSRWRKRKGRALATAAV